MTEIPSPYPLTIARSLLAQEPYGPTALNALAEHHNYEAAFAALWSAQQGNAEVYSLPDDRPGLWQLTLKRVRQEVCGEDDSFRTKVKDYKKSPTSAPLLTGLVMYLVGLAGLPIDPTIATIIVLYVLHIGLDVFCEYTAPGKEE